MGAPGGFLDLVAARLGHRPALEAFCQLLYSICERLYLPFEPFYAVLNGACTWAAAR